jgi:predicted nucleic acid-binding protein
MEAPGLFVLDSSVTLTWCFEDEASDYGDAVLQSLRSREAIVPVIWPLEVANALLMGERRARSTQADTLRWIQLLAALPITVDEESSERAFQATLDLGRVHNLTTYDAAYLEVALRRGLPLATLDQRLHGAAAAIGVVIYQGL